MDFVDLVAPSAAVLALFLVLALVVQSFRHGRAIRKLEGRLIEAGEASEPASLERLAELSQRAAKDSRPGERRVSWKPVLGFVAVIAVIGLGIAGAWWVLRGDDGSTAQTDAGATSQQQAPEQQPDPATVPVTPPPLEAEAKAAYEVAVLNASGVPLAAADRVMPLVVAQGYQRGAIGDSPDGTDDLSESFVMYVNGEQALGFNLANDLGVDRAVPLDGVTPEDIGNADAVVVIGTDLANG
jgi:hypothetical protein